MKKILSILGTITIAGSGGMAGLVGNAPATAKNETNHLQTNNLLRNKRQYVPYDPTLRINYELAKNQFALAQAIDDAQKLKQQKAQQN